MTNRRKMRRLGILWMAAALILFWEIASIAQTPPEAGDLLVTTDEDTPVAITLSGSDVESCELTFSIVTPPASGSLGAITDNVCIPGSPNTDTASVTYTPNPNFNGSDSFTYQVTDGDNEVSNVATGSITVDPVNDLPVADDKAVSTNLNTPATITLSGDDVETCELTFSIVTLPANGTLSPITDNLCAPGSPDADTASVTYTPNLDFAGNDSFTYQTHDGTDISNLATVSIAVTSADLAISKNASSSSVVAGGQISYTLSVTNNGPADAQAVVIDDILPSSDFTILSVNSSPPGCSAMPCTFSTLGVGSVIVVDLLVQVDSDTLPSPPDYIDTGTVSSDTHDPDLSNNSDTEATTVTSSAGLSISKSDDEDPVIAGTNLTYTITVDNAGPSAARDVVVTDPLPDGTTFVSASLGGTFDPLSNTVTWDLGTIGVGQPPVSLTLVVQVDSDRTQPILNTASVGGSTPDPNRNDDTDTETTDVVTSADLAVTKSDEPDPVVAGETLTYTVTVTNLGPSDAVMVQMIDTLPSGVTFVSADPSGCSEVAGVVTCDAGTLPVGGSLVWTITVLVDKVGPTVADGTVLTNRAEVASETADPSPDNDVAAEDTVVSAPDLMLVKTADPPSGSTVSPGELIVFTISYSNLGSSTATNLVITDEVSPLLGSVTPSPGGVFDPDTRTITWNVGTVGPAGDPSASGTVSFSARVGASSRREIIRNEAFGIAEELADPVSSNRTTHVLEPPDILIAKSADRPENSEVKAFDLVTYQLVVRNLGAGRALGVVVTDDPPPFMNYVVGSTTLDGAPVADDGGTTPLFTSGITLTLNPNAQHVFTFKMTVDVAAPAGLLLENWGYVTWNLGTQTSGDFYDLRVLRPLSGPTLTQTILVQEPTGRTIFITVFNEVLGLLPATGYQSLALLLLALSAVGLGSSLTGRVSSARQRGGNER